MERLRPVGEDLGSGAAERGRGLVVVGHAVQRDKAGVTRAREHDRADRDLHPIQLALHGAGAAPTEEDEKCGHEGTLAVLLAEELDPRRMARGA